MKIGNVYFLGYSQVGDDMGFVTIPVEVILSLTEPLSEGDTREELEAAGLDTKPLSTEL